MFNVIRQHAVSCPLAIGEDPSDGEQKPQPGGGGSGFQVTGMIEGFS